MASDYGSSVIKDTDGIIWDTNESNSKDNGLSVVNDTSGITWDDPIDNETSLEKIEVTAPKEEPGIIWNAIAKSGEMVRDLFKHELKPQTVGEAYTAALNQQALGRRSEGYIKQREEDVYGNPSLELDAKGKPVANHGALEYPLISPEIAIGGFPRIVSGIAGMARKAPEIASKGRSLFESGSAYTRGSIVGDALGNTAAEKTIELLPEDFKKNNPGLTNLVGMVAGITAGGYFGGKAEGIASKYDDLLEQVDKGKIAPEAAENILKQDPEVQQIRPFTEIVQEQMKPTSKTYQWSDKPNIWSKVNEHLEASGEAPIEVPKVEAPKQLSTRAEQMKQAAEIPVGGSEDEAAARVKSMMKPELDSEYKKMTKAQREELEAEHERAMQYGAVDEHGNPLDDEGNSLFAKTSANKAAPTSTKVEGKSKEFKRVENSVRKLTGQSPEKVKDRIIIVEKESDLPEQVQNDIRKSNSSGTVSGVYHHPNGKVYVIAELAGRGGVRNPEVTILHELTHRAFMREMIDERIMDRIYDLAKEDPLVQEAQRRVRNAETDPRQVDQETLAYLMEAYHEGHIKSGKLKEIIEDVIQALKRAVGKAKVFLGKTTPDELINKMTGADIANYIRSVAKKEAKSRKKVPTRKEIYGNESVTLTRKGSSNKQPTGGKYEPTTKDKLIETIQDYWRPVEVLLKDADAGELVNNARKNIYGRVEYRIGKVKTQQEKVIKNITEYAKSSKQTVEQVRKDLNSFMIAQHAGERNAALGAKAAGISTFDAKKSLATLKKNDPKRYAMYVALARQVRDMNKQTLDILLDGQVITKELYDNLRSKYKMHIPLNRILENEDATAGMIGGKGFNVKSTGLKKAKGSELEVSDIIGNVSANVQEAIIRAEKNRVGLEMYKVFNTPKGQMLGKTRGLKMIGKDHNGNPLMETPTDDMIVLYVDGKKKVIVPNDPIIAKVYNMMNVEERGMIANILGPITSTIGGLYTRFNPEFALSNIIRDIQEAFVYNVTKLGTKGATKALSKEATSMNAVKDWIIGKDSAGARLYEDMMTHGGTTGGISIANKTKITEDVEDMFKLAQSKPRQAVKGIFKSVDNFNRIFEDSTRLAAYKQALEQGMTKDQAAVIAKEATIDFNRKGTQTPWVNALYMFSNASVQGSTKMLRAMKDPKVLAGVVGTITALSFMVDSHNDMIDPDWRDKTSEQERQSNYVWVIKGEDGKFSRVLIPIGWGVKPIKAMVESMRDVAYGKETQNPFITISKAVISGYNPIGGNDMFSAITPTVLDVASDIYRDKNWKGESINPKGMEFAQPSEKYFPQTPETLGGRIAIKVAQGTEEIGLDLTPEDYKYIVKSYGGGPMNFSSGLMALFEKASKGEKSAPEDRVFLRRFYKETDPERLAKYEAKLGATKAIKHIASGNTREEKLAILKEEMAKASPDEKKKIYYAVKYGKLIPTGKNAKRLEERKQWEENITNPFKSELTR